MSGCAYRQRAASYLRDRSSTSDTIFWHGSISHSLSPYYYCYCYIRSLSLDPQEPCPGARDKSRLHRARCTAAHLGEDARKLQRGRTRHLASPVFVSLCHIFLRTGRLLSVASPATSNFMSVSVEIMVEMPTNRARACALSRAKFR